MSEAERPRSSWQHWVRSAEQGRQEPGSAGDADEDLDVVLRWGEGDDGDDRPSDPSAPDPSAADALAELEEVAYDEAGNEVEAGIVDGGADDAGWMEDDEADLEELADEGEFGELLPPVPFLPSIAGRVDALGGVLRSIAHRVDGLNAATDVYRSTIVDRIDEFTETVLEQGRRADASLDEYRRTTERTIGELRRRLAEQGDLSGRVLARVEEVATDVASIVADVPTRGLSDLATEVAALKAAVGERASAGAADVAAEVAGEVARLRDALDAQAAGGSSEVAAELAGLRSLLEEVVVAPGGAPAAAEDPELRRRLDALGAVVERTDADLADLAAAHQGTERTLGHLRELLEVVVDTMPASAEGSGAELGPLVAGIASKLDRLEDRLAAGAAPVGVPSLDAATIGDLADAVVARLDLDALATLVAEHLASGFEVVHDEPAPPGRDAEAAAIADEGSRRGRRRR